MKTMTCKNLGGPCDYAITGDSFEAVGRKFREHVIEQMRNGEPAHIAAAAKMRNMTPEAQKAMMDTYRKRYEETPEE